jgi:putative sigma-54 modulation protein
MQQALTVKEKWVTRKRRAPGVKGLVGGATAAQADGTSTSALAQARADTIRVTRYAVKPMSLEDAALRIEEGREPFVIFRRAETERINILYRRPDGRLGLIDPES